MSGKKDKSGRRVTPAALVLFVALVLFLWLAPGYLYPILASDIFSEEVQKRRESMYTGVITVGRWILLKGARAPGRPGSIDCLLLLKSSITAFILLCAP